VVAAGLILLGLWLSIEAFAGGWRKRAEAEAPFQPSPFLWVSAGLFVHMVLIGWAGFVVAGTVLFACVARGFGSSRWARNVAVGLVLSLAIFFFFVKLLNVNLPGGWLEPILGSAGI
jgi:putative tricarboxylic transport membrane protein